MQHMHYFRGGERGHGPFGSIFAVVRHNGAPAPVRFIAFTERVVNPTTCEYEFRAIPREQLRPCPSWPPAAREEYEQRYADANSERGSALLVALMLVCAVLALGLAGAHALIDAAQSVQP